MALSYIEYPGDGSQRDFVVTFPYLSRSHVSVEVDETLVEFAWVNNTLVRLSGVPSTGSVVRISRHTPVDQSLIDFAHGGRLAEDDLDTMTLQILYLLQEDLEMREDTHNHDKRYYTELEADALLALKSNIGHLHDDRYYTEAEITTFLSEKANAAHNHDDRYYTETEVDTFLASKATAGHNHDDRYYTESEVDTFLAGKSPTSHLHDDRYYTEDEINTLLSGYYTEAEVDTLLAGKAPASHNHDDRYYTEAEIDDLLSGIAGPDSHNHDERYYTETEIDTLLASKVNTSTTISAGTGLSGGGSLAASRTISHASHTGDVTGSTTLTIGNGKVTQAKLKTSNGSVQTSEEANLTLPGGSYGFYPQLRVDATLKQPGRAWLGYDFANTTYATIIYLRPGASGAPVYAQQRYVTSSGEVFWIFLLRNKSTGLIEASFQSPDHPCFGNGNDPLLCPHPFLDYDPLKHEIIVVNPDQSTVDMMKRMCRPQRMGERPLDLLELIVEEKHKRFEIDENSEREYSKTPVTVGIIHDLNEKPLWLLDEAPIIHLPIPQPEYVKVKALVERRPKTYVY